MDNKREAQQFLTAARGRLSPERAGVAVFGGERRVPGLRREEVAHLAGVSTDYYTKMERGDLSGVSEGVLLAVARGLLLDEAETTHLLNLARASTGRARRRRTRPEVRVPPRLVQLVDAMPDVPVIAQDRLSRPVASNALGRALFPDLFPAGAAPINHALYIFLDPRARTFYADWDTSARGAVAAMRLAAWQEPDDVGLMALVGRLTTQSPEFRTWWGDHRVRTHGSGVKHIHHPVVGQLTLASLNLAAPTVPGISISTYLTDPGTPSADALDLLRSWIASPAQGRRRDPATEATPPLDQP